MGLNMKRYFSNEMNSQNFEINAAESDIFTLAEPDEIIISIYKNKIPEFSDVTMERIYGSIFSIPPKFKMNENSANTNTYIVRKGSQIITFFLFSYENKKIKVINEVIPISRVDIHRFADSIFKTYRSAAVIWFHAIETERCMLPFPFQLFNCLEDIVLTLPNTPEKYMANLGKNMRESIKRYTAKINKDFPSFQHCFYEKNEIDEQYIRDIVRLSSARMEIKKQLSAHSDEKTEELIRMVKMYGVVSIAMIGGKICGGVICCRVGTNFFMHVVAHDPLYDHYRLGKICCYLSIRGAIERGGNEYHFLWGRYDYKFGFMGVQRNLYNLVIYRSGMQLIFNTNVALKFLFKGYGRGVKQWMLNGRRRNCNVCRLSIKIFDRLRRLGGMYRRSDN